MDNIISRYRNASVLAAVLFLQILGLAIQVKRPVDTARPEAGRDRLIRIWAVGAITPVEKAIVKASRFFGSAWHDYLDLRGVRAQNSELKRQIEGMRLEQVRLAEDAGQARRLQALLAFKEQYVQQTVAAQVIGTSGSEQSRLVYLDKGSHDGIKRDMAVITPNGIAGKVKEVFGGTSQVLLINDQLSGAGAILENSRLQGTVKGTPAGGLVLDHIMADEKVQAGERVLTSGGDQIFPKGFLIGTVAEVSGSNDQTFLTVRIKPGADLNRLEEVLVITHIEDRTPVVAEGAPPPRAADVLADRLPTFKPSDANAAANAKPGTPQSAAAKPADGVVKKPAATAVPPADTATKPSAPAAKPGVAPAKKIEGTGPTIQKPAAPAATQGGTPR